MEPTIQLELPISQLVEKLEVFEREQVVIAILQNTTESEMQSLLTRIARSLLEWLGDEEAGQLAKQFTNTIYTKR